MRTVKSKKADLRSNVEFRSYFGKREPRNRYILVKTHIRRADHFNVFSASELKGACLDILGLEDSKETRNVNAAVRAAQVWKHS